MTLFSDNFVEVPWPIDVDIERQMGNSVIVKWSAPERINTRDIKGYSIQVDGEHRQTVLGSARTKALISDLNLDKVLFFLLLERLNFLINFLKCSL